ncbi:flagellar type III secretion system pore protein FliP [Thermodesulfobacteriota bacterium]
MPSIGINVSSSDSPEDVSATIQIIILLTILTLSPAILILMTSFTRIIVVLSFLRNALGTQQMPPNQVLIGLSLFLTFFIMSPVFTQISDNALDPYFEKKISLDEAVGEAKIPIHAFLIRQTREKDIRLFFDLSKEALPENASAVPFKVLVPAFVISELKTAFQIGFILFLPFVIIDMTVASVLMSMGMFMLPPMMISLPFKIILFVLVDGWFLLIGSLAKSFL